MIRRAFESGLPASGLVGKAAPLSGSTRMIVPLRPTGSPLVRKSWLRRATFGGRWRQHAADGSRRIAAGVRGAAALTVVCVREARPVAPTRVQRSVRPERNRADRMARELLTPVLDENLLRSCHSVSRCLEPTQASAHDAAISHRAWRSRTRIARRRLLISRVRPPLRRTARIPEDVVVRVEHVHVWPRREARVELHPEEAAIPEVVDVARRSRVHRTFGSWCDVSRRGAVTCLAHRSSLDEDPDRCCGGCRGYEGQHPVPAEQEQHSQEHESAGDQTGSPHHALPRLSSTSDAHPVTLPAGLADERCTGGERNVYRNASLRRRRPLPPPLLDRRGSW